ncbi:MAG: CoA ester lyase [Devosia sp.]|uniref:HpcH/HpaI aldolase/citrate lyase family protein n=1 Tax=Devosia sp. TaxID=1871048 RepID=UPI0024C976D9|nr:CoA ester lyase [Devosia sp.]UYO00519.1 MAG: CoA ester lyase [Devosia sp.]
MRSLLYVPADQDRFIAKAHLRGADGVILDLEDAVPEDRKAVARANLGTAIASLRQGNGLAAVRINPGDVEDVRAAVAAGADLIVLPKADGVALDTLAGVLAAAGVPDQPVLATIEGPAALLEVAAIARHPNVSALNLGSEDFSLAMGAVPDPDVLRQPKLMVHYAAKAAGKLSLGLLRSIADYADLDAIKAAAAEARRHGFDGSTCVHPSAVPFLNAAFAPSPEELRWARAVLATSGTVGLDGKMIDKPLRERAKAILRSASE